MKLKLIYKKADDIPAGYSALYEVQADGTFKFVGVDGIRPEADYQQLSNQLNSEKAAHEASKTALTSFTKLNLTADQISTMGVELSQLREAAKSGKTEDQIKALVDAKVAEQVNPMKAKLKATKEDLERLNGENTTLKSERRNNMIRSEIIKAATAANVNPSALEDIVLRAGLVFDINEDGKMLTKENSGVTPYISPEVWLTEMQPTQTHWWPASAGGNSGGSNFSGNSSDNPFTKDNWNVTKQMQLVASDRVKAEQLAKSAGTTIGGTQPK